MQITLYKNFAKVSNSTKRPTGGTTYDCKFKDATSYHNPQVLLAASFSDLAGVTYGYMDDNYYYVDDITTVANGLTEVSLTNDPLATWKGTISNYQGFIERGPVSTTFDDWAYDDMLNPVDKIRSAVSQYTLITGYNSNDGVFVMKTESILNPVGYGYLLTESEISSVLNKASIAGIDTSKITEIKYYPISLSAISNYTAISAVHMGNESVIVSCRYLNNGIHVSGNSTLTVPARVYNDSRDYDPRFTETILRVFGHETAIDNLYLRDGELTVQTEIDLGDGVVRVQVFGDNKYAFMGTAPIGITIPVIIPNNSHLKDIAKSIAGQTLNLIPSFKSSINTGLDNIYASIASQIPKKAFKKAAKHNVSPKFEAFVDGSEIDNIRSNAKSTLITSAANNILNMHTVAHSIGSGVTGAIGDLEVGRVLLEVIRYSSQDADRGAIGYPILSVSNIAAIGENGFYKFRNPHLAVPDIQSENDAINAYLASGFYYE